METNSVHVISEKVLESTAQDLTAATEVWTDTKCTHLEHAGRQRLTSQEMQIQHSFWIICSFT